MTHNIYQFFQSIYFVISFYLLFKATSPILFRFCSSQATKVLHVLGVNRKQKFLKSCKNDTIAQVVLPKHKFRIKNKAICILKSTFDTSLLSPFYCLNSSNLPLLPSKIRFSQDTYEKHLDIPKSIGGLSKSPSKIK